MIDNENFQIILFIFVIIFSGVFYLPINFLENIHSKKLRKIYEEKMIKKRKLLVKKKRISKTLKNLSETSISLSENLNNTKFNPSS